MAYDANPASARFSDLLPSLAHLHNIRSDSQKRTFPRPWMLKELQETTKNEASSDDLFRY
jgi:hypothetical protein